MRHRILILSRLAHRNEIVRDALPAERRVFFELLVEQTDSFGALHSGNWIFPDDNLRMIDPSGVYGRSNQLSPEVLQSDELLPESSCWEGSCSEN